MFLGLSEHGAQLMTNNDENSTDNVTQIVFLNQQDEMKEGIPQVNKYLFIHNRIVVLYVIYTTKCIIY